MFKFKKLEDDPVLNLWRSISTGLFLKNFEKRAHPKGYMKNATVCYYRGVLILKSGIPLVVIGQ